MKDDNVVDGNLAINEIATTTYPSTGLAAALERGVPIPPSGIPFNLNFAKGLSPEADKTIEDMFTYHPWDEDQNLAGITVRNALASAARRIVDAVPPCPTRTRAINMLVDARMLCNAAITFRGRY